MWVAHVTRPRFGSVHLLPPNRAFCHWVEGWDTLGLDISLLLGGGLGAARSGSLSAVRGKTGETQGLLAPPMRVEGHVLLPGSGGVALLVLPLPSLQLD